MSRLYIGIFDDEANFLASKEIQHSCFMNEPTFFQVVRLGREFGIGFVSATNEPTALSNTLKTNAYIKILLRSGRYEETMDMARSINLTKEQTEFISSLREGQGTVSIGGMKPFPCTFPFVPIEKNVTDQEIDRHNHELLKGTEFEGVLEMDEPGEMPGQENPRDVLTEEERGFLWDVHNRPYLSVKERMDRINL